MLFLTHLLGVIVHTTIEQHHPPKEIRSTDSTDYRDLEPNFAEETISHVVRKLTIFTFVFYVFITLGLIKALIGVLCSREIGLCGLGFLIELPRSLREYHETELRDMPVVYDDDGWPINPKTGERVRPIQCNTQFCLNVIFFLIIPFAFLHEIWLSYRCRETCSNESMLKGGDIDIYSDDEVDENQDMNYVLEQMQKSELSLKQCVCEKASGS